ncbi:hypothetical protein [Bradyrhizobium viridifuturi]|uniref:hypothetical protein n=1 Tax=Bradyrhizobium viridifuturi TaxID=1654716 RepID=UPI000AA9D1F2|nr:hypothetical protein [Bradyrhizobium viridifuturi]
MIDLSTRRVDLLDRPIRIIGSILFEPPRRIGLSPHACHNSTNAATDRRFRALREKANCRGRRIGCVNSRLIGQD